MEDWEVNYIQDSIVELHKDIGQAMYYIPYDEVNSSVSFGKIHPIFKESQKLLVYGNFGSVDTLDPDVALEASLRGKAELEICLTQLTAAGFTLKKRDAFDIVVLDTTTRYVVEGFDNSQRYIGLYVRLQITELEKAIAAWRE